MGEVHSRLRRAIKNLSGNFEVRRAFPEGPEGVRVIGPIMPHVAQSVDETVLYVRMGSTSKDVRGILLPFQDLAAGAVHHQWRPALLNDYQFRIMRYALSGKQYHTIATGLSPFAISAAVEFLRTVKP
jgi:hypothetical protein